MDAAPLGAVQARPALSALGRGALSAAWRQRRACAGRRPLGVAAPAAPGPRGGGPGGREAPPARGAAPCPRLPRDSSILSHRRGNTESSAGSGFSLPPPRPERLRGEGGSLCVHWGRALVGGSSALSVDCPALPVPFAQAVTSAEGSAAAGADRGLPADSTAFVVLLLFLLLLSRPRWERFQAAPRREPRKPPRHPGPPVPRIRERGGTPAPSLPRPTPAASSRASRLAGAEIAFPFPGSSPPPQHLPFPAAAGPGVPGKQAASPPAPHGAAAAGRGPA